MISFAFLFDLAFAMYTMILKNPMCLFLRFISDETIPFFLLFC